MSILVFNIFLTSNLLGTVSKALVMSIVANSVLQNVFGGIQTFVYVLCQCCWECSG